MAGRDRMTIEEVVRRVLREEHGDVIRESVRAFAQELMEAEVSELIGAERGERSEDRATHRNASGRAWWSSACARSTSPVASCFIVTSPTTGTAA
jgi:putative transposase